MVNQLMRIAALLNIYGLSKRDYGIFTDFGGQI